MKKALKTPREYAKNDAEPRYEPVATRVTYSTVKALREAAQSEGKSVCWLVGKVLDDYVRMLKGRK